MTDIVLFDADCEAYGHPTECQEPVSGVVSGVSNPKVTLDGKGVYFHSEADMEFSSHAHDYTSSEGCHDMQSHSIDPDNTHNVTLDGSTIVIESDEGIDPGSGGQAIFVNDGGNESFKLLE